MPNTITDPVCGMPAGAEGGLGTFYQGQVFYFCSDLCKQTFLADPAKYAGAAPARAAGQADTTAYLENYDMDRSDSDSVNDRGAQDLYHKLRTVIVPMFYRDRERWIDIMRQSIAFNASFFNTHRMVQQYAAHAYV